MSFSADETIHKPLEVGENLCVESSGATFDETMKFTVEKEKTEAGKILDAVYAALKEKGYPDDFCREIAYKQMNTDYTATRMLGYLYRVSNPRPEDVVDEMLAILSDRNAIIQKKELEHAQATINRIYREGL